MAESRRITAGPEQAGRRLDVVLAGELDGYTRSQVQALIGDGLVRLNGQPAKASSRVGDGAVLDVELDYRDDRRTQAEELPLNVVYEDHDMAVIDKPAGLVVHPAAGHAAGTLANALAFRFPATRDIGDTIRPGIVHRLDKDTSGLLAVALSRRGQASLQEQIASREMKREYLALAQGHVMPEVGRIEAPIGRDPENRKRMAPYGAAARPAQTSYRVLELLPGFTFLAARLHTGRTHQIRVHFAAIGHPIAGDLTYSGPRLPGLDRQFLHAHRLTLTLPATGEQREFESPLPDDLRVVLERLQSG